uniref:Uncharacterized protein n=1 Tax=Arundo donax TaxID=35708 RepID=A0A0A9GDA9_ARUDO
MNFLLLGRKEYESNATVTALLRAVLSKSNFFKRAINRY